MSSHSSLRFPSALALAVVALASIIAGTPFFAFAQAGGGPERVKKLDSLVQALKDHDKFMGTIVIAKAGVPVYSRSLGFASMSSKQPSTVETEYRIGSASKMFTAAMIFQLIQEGKLALDTKLAQFYQQIPNADRITIGQMLSHHSGIFDLTHDSTYAEWLSKPQTEDELLHRIASGTPAFDPGTSAEYSNSNYVLLGMILQKVTKKSFAENLTSRITTPLALSHTYVGGKIGSHPNEANSYTNANGWHPSTETDMSVPGGAGAIVSTAGDLARFITALMNGKIVSNASLETMKELHDRYGMGLFPIPFYERAAYGHSGHIDDFTSSVGYFPDDSTSLVVLSNGSSVAFNTVLLGVLCSWYGTTYEIPSFTEFAVAPERLKDYAATYSAPEIGLTITVGISNGTLYAQATGQSAFPLTPTAEDRFAFDAAGIRMIFHRDANASVTGFSIVQGGTTTEFKRDQ